jgi:hypothetical protein
MTYMFVYGNVSLNSSWNEIAPERVVNKIEKHILRFIKFLPENRAV